MTPTILFVLIVSLAAIAVVAAGMRVAYLVADGRSEEPLAVTTEPADELDLAA